MAIKKQCKQCNQEFEITDEDLAFYKKISPTFAGKTFEIPPPTLCSECRHIRRLIWRNERHLYKRKCDLCKKEIISIYSPDKSLKVYCQQCWWSDGWEAKSHGKIYQPGKFLKQLEELYLEIPKIGTSVVNSTDCDYATNVAESKNCYMASSVGRSENCFYGRKILDSKDMVDSLFVFDCENCYEAVSSEHCGRCFFINECKNCTDSIFLSNCNGCHNCFMCTNLANKTHHLFNKPYAEKEYKSKVAELWNGSSDKIKKLKKDYIEMISASVRRENQNTNCEDCLGDYLMNCKNCKISFDCKDGENLKYYFDTTGFPTKNSMDGDVATGEWNYESVSCYGGYKCLFGAVNYRNNRDLLHCIDCFNGCQNMLGCVSMKREQYYILNKKYSPGDYEKTASKIIEELQEAKRWGEFLPVNLSPFGYNETLAIDYFKKSRAEALKTGLKWQDEDFSTKYDGQFYKPDDNINDYLGDDEEGKVSRILAGVLECEVSGKPFRIMPQEAAFYLRNRIPFPRTHFLVRLEERFKLKNPRTLWHRQCMNKGCENEFETTYAPDRPEKVYCESCYQKVVL